jgi:hypothetical protein
MLVPGDDTMELTVNDKVIAAPSAADIARALEGDSFPQDWTITLDREDGEMLDAEAMEDGRFTLVHAQDKRRRHAVPNVDPALLKSILTKYLNGDPDWQSACQWADGYPGPPPKPAAVSATGGSTMPKPSALRSLIGLVILGSAIYLGWRVMTEGTGFINAAFPNAEAKLALLTGGMGAAALLIFLGMHAYSKAAQSWPFVTGKIVVSSIERSTDGDSGDGGTHRSYAPVIEYAYEVAGQTYRSRQVKLGFTSSGSESWARGVAAKYPVGAPVEVHYDPGNPAIAALDNPTGMTWLIFALAMALFGFSAYALGVFK